MQGIPQRKAINADFKIDELARSAEPFFPDHKISVSLTNYRFLKTDKEISAYTLTLYAWR